MYCKHCKDPITLSKKEVKSCKCGKISAKHITKGISTKDFSIHYFNT